MPLPDRVTFGPITYDVVLRELDDSYARFHHTEQRISVDVSVKADRRRMALLHEIVHVLIHLSVNHDLGDADEERIVTAIAPWLLQLLRDNPVLVAYLTAADAAPDRPTSA